MFIFRFIIIIIELILCYILQSSVFSGMMLNHTIPDLLMVIVVAAAYMKGSNAGIIYGFCAGMILDLTYGTHLGFFALIYMLCGFFSGLFHKLFRKDDNITPLTLMALCTIFCQSAYFVVEFMIKGRLEYQFYFANIILPKTIYTVLVAALLYKLFQISILWSIRFEERNIKDYD